MNQPVDPQNTREVNARVQELANSGLGRNAIAKRLGLTRYRVSKASEELGIGFDRSATRAATAAKVADAQAEREELAAQFRSVARVILSKVLSSSPEELNPLELKEWIWTAGSAASSDARYGKLALDAVAAKSAQRNTEDMDDVVEALRAGITEIVSVPTGELIAMLDGEV